MIAKKVKSKGAKAQRKRKVRAKKKKAAKKRSRAPLTEAECQRLGYDYPDLLEADLNCPAKPNLSKILEKHPRLRAKFRRGQLLQQMRRLPPVTEYISHAAVRLKKMGFLDFERGQDLRDFLDRDGEARQIWTESDANAWIDNREAVLALAKEGNVKAIQMMDAWFTGRERDAAEPGLNVSHMTQKDIAELFGVSRVTMREWSAMQHCPRNSDESYHLGDVIRWHTDWTRRKAAGGGKALPIDEMRAEKLETLRMNNEQRRANLLDREGVIYGLCLRWQSIVKFCQARVREMASQLHGQTVERIEAIIGDSFEQLQQEWLNVPMESLRLEPEAEGRFLELLNSVKSDLTAESTE